MARITYRDDTAILKIREFLGVNENPDGDTNIRTGELARMRNFAITRDRHLQIRPGQRTVLDLRPAWDTWAGTHPGHPQTPALSGAWTGTVGGETVTLCAFGGAVFRLDLQAGSAAPMGGCTQGHAHFFGFGDAVYLLTGREYLRWDGGDGGFVPVEGYVPTVKTACTPEGQGQDLEKLNRLTGRRRVKFSPDGRATAFCLPDREVDEIVSVTGTGIKYTLDARAGKVNFASAPPKGTNTLAIVYRKGTGSRADVERMRFSELYNGASDARVFLYGDGTNRTVYSGTELDSGRPTAEYFPDLGEAAVGDANTPITAMVRHFARLLVFKTDSTWGVDYTTVNLPGGSLTSAFRVVPVNRNLGNAAPGQVRLLENDPLTIDTGGVYQWQAAPGSVGDNRSAQRLEQRVRRTFAAFRLPELKTFNRREHSEFWFFQDGQAAIFNYGGDCWTIYDGMDFAAMLEVGGETYGFTPAGAVRHLSRRYRNDDGAPIEAYAETGAMDFDRPWRLKFSPGVYAALQPESGGRITLAVETNRRGDYPACQAAAGFATFSHVDFGHFSFGTNRKPQLRRLPLRIRKATYYKLIFKSRSASAAATVLETDIRVRFGGRVK